MKKIFFLVAFGIGAMGFASAQTTSSEPAQKPACCQSKSASAKSCADSKSTASADASKSAKASCCADGAKSKSKVDATQKATSPARKESSTQGNSEK